MSDRVRTAYHEASHAIVALGAGLSLACVSIEPRGDARGRIELDIAPRSSDLPSLTDEQRAVARMFDAVWSVSGAVGEEIALGATGDGVWLDELIADDAMERVNDVAGTFSWMWRFAVRSTARRYLLESWRSVTRLACALLDEGTLSDARAREVAGTLTPFDMGMITGSLDFWRARMAAREAAHAVAR